MLVIQVQVDFNTNQSYDEANPLVLPSKKRKTLVKRDRPNAHRILSNKQRKHLEKIVDRKKRKQDVSYHYYTYDLFLLLFVFNLNLRRELVYCNLCSKYKARRNY